MKMIVFFFLLYCVLLCSVNSLASHSGTLPSPYTSLSQRCTSSAVLHTLIPTALWWQWTRRTQQKKGDVGETVFVLTSKAKEILTQQTCYQAN